MTRKVILSFINETPKLCKQIDENTLKIMNCTVSGFRGRGKCIQKMWWIGMNKCTVDCKTTKYVCTSVKFNVFETYFSTKQQLLWTANTNSNVILYPKIQF